jgi:hypothetical protein
MNVEIGAEAALFPEKEYINGIAVAVRTGPQGYTARIGSLESILGLLKSLKIRALVFKPVSRRSMSASYLFWQKPV